MGGKGLSTMLRSQWSANFPSDNGTGVEVKHLTRREHEEEGDDQIDVNDNDDLAAAVLTPVLPGKERKIICQVFARDVSINCTWTGFLA
jgi:hypothetical protein